MWLRNVKGQVIVPATMSGYAMVRAWSLLKALEEHQIRDLAGRAMGTAPPAIRGMMGRRHRTFLPEQMTSQPSDLEGRPHTDPEYSPFVGQHPIPTWRAHQREEPEGPEFESRPIKQGPGEAPLVTRPVEPFREHTDTMPEEGFLTPTERLQALEGLRGSLVRNVGGQQRGEQMVGSRLRVQAPMEGVARGMKLRRGARAFEPETIERETHTPEQLEVMRRNEELAALAAEMGIDFTPQEVPPSPEPEEEEPQFRTAGAVARRAGMDERMKEKPFQMTSVDVDPRQAQAMAGGDMGQMDFGPEGQPMMGQEGLRQRLFDIAQQKARQKYRPEAQAGEQSSEIQAMQAELDRRG